MPEATFSHKDYNQILDDTLTEMRKLGNLKGGEYAGDDDRLANFRRNGLALGLPMEAVWHTYTAKHWDAITQYIRDTVHGTTRPRMEPVTGRVDDMLVYLILFKCMLAERAASPSNGE